MSSLTKSGITRRIDELGRIVIPKEMRSNLGIRDGEPLELYIESNAIIIKKFSQVENIKEISNKICSIISDTCKVDLLITDREKIIVASNNLKNLATEKLNDKMKFLIDNRESYISNTKEEFFKMNKYFIMIPIITSTDCSGLIIIVNDEKKEENIIYAKIAQKLIVQSLDVS